jgi:hypothetical protein
MMMEKDDFLKDDFLRELIQRSPLDSPSDEFVNRVMANIQVVPEVSAVRKPIYENVKSAIPYAAITLFLFFVIATSDLPIFNWLPGKDYLVNNLLTYLGTFFSVLKSAFSSRFVSWGLLISLSAGILFLIDLAFSRRASV